MVLAPLRSSPPSPLGIAAARSALRSAPGRSQQLRLRASSGDSLRSARTILWSKIGEKAPSNEKGNFLDVLEGVHEFPAHEAKPLPVSSLARSAPPRRQTQIRPAAALATLVTLLLLLPSTTAAAPTTAAFPPPYVNLSAEIVPSAGLAPGSAPYPVHLVTHLATAAFDPPAMLCALALAALSFLGCWRPFRRRVQRFLTPGPHLIAFLVLMLPLPASVDPQLCGFRDAAQQRAQCACPHDRSTL